MALITCDECGKEASDKAVACPNCGAPIAGETTAMEAAVEVVPKRQKTRPVFIVLGLLLVGGTFLVYRGQTNERAAPPSAGLAAQLRKPQVVVNEAMTLKEGQAQMYTFTLNTDARVQVQVVADPKNVDVMFMTGADLETYKKAMGKLFGGEFSYRKALSAQGVLKMDETATVPRGKWAVVMQRPREALRFGKETKATVKVTVY